MKHTVLAISHSAGSFTVKSGADVGQKRDYDFYLLHAVRKCRENVGGVEVIHVKATPTLYAQLVAECGGHPEDVLNRKLDLDVEKAFGKYTLKDWEIEE